MALLDDSEMTWSFANGSMSLLDFIDSDDNKENDSTFIFNEPLLQIPTDGFKDDIFDLLSIEELHSLSDIKPSVDSLPSYDQIIKDCTKSEECFSFDKLNISNIKQEPMSAHIKQEPVEMTSDLTALRAVTPASHYTNKLRYGVDCAKPLSHDLDTIFQKEDSMSISLDDITSIINNNQDLADSLSPISPNSISSEGSSETFISSGLSDFESSPKRAPMTGPTKKPRRRKATDSTNSPHLWQFILELLGNTDNKDVIAWTGLEHHFKVHNSRELARLWGMRKNKPRMNFDKLSRAMRYYYDKNIIRHIPGQRLVYKFCRNADDAVYTRLLTEASRTIPPLPLVTCTARTPVKVTKSYPAKYSPLSPSTSAYKTSLNKSVKDAFNEQQQLNTQQRYYLQQQQLQRQQQSCFNAQVQLQQQEQVRQQQQLAVQQQQIQMQQMQLSQIQMPCTSPQQMPMMGSPQQLGPQMSPVHNGTNTSHMSPVQGMAYQPLQHFTPSQSCFDDFYNVQPTIQGNCSPNHIMPTIQGSPNHLINNGSNTSTMLQQSSPTSSNMMYTPATASYTPVSTTSYYDNFYQPY